MTSIVIILPYFGKLPNYFGLWLQSCINNPTIDWTIFTDCDTSQLPVSSNINIVKISYSDFKRKFEDYFEFDTNINRPYKLCDLKPFFRFVLEEYVENYDFWGYCDCDLIFGDIRKYATDEILSGCDKFLGHGHFSLHRTKNDGFLDIIKSIKYRGQYDIRYVLNNPDVCAFEEYDHMGLAYSYLRYFPDRLYTGYKSDNKLFNDVYTLYPEIGDKNKYPVNEANQRIFNDVYNEVKHFKDRVSDKKFGGKLLLYSYSNGKLFRVIFQKWKVRREEILYLHLIKRKMKVCTENTNFYTIVPNKFIEFNENPSFLYFLIYGRIRYLKELINYLRKLIKIRTRLRNLKILK